MIYSAVISLVNVLSDVASIVALHFGAGLNTVVFVIVGSGFVAALSSLVFLRWQFGLRRFFDADYTLWRRLLIAALPFGAIVVVNTAGLSVGPIMLTRVAGEAAVGYYSVAIKLISVITLVVTAYNAAVYPVFSRLNATSPTSLQTGYELSMKIMLIAGLPGCTALTLVAGHIMGLVFPGYLPAIPALQVLAWSLLGTLLATPPLNVLYANRQQSQATLIFVVAAGIGTVLNAILIPALGLIGACAAIVAISATQACIAPWMAAWYLRLSLGKTALRAIVLAVIIALVGILCRSLNVLVTIPLMMVVFIAAALPMRLFTVEELAILAGLPLLSRLAPAHLTVANEP